MVNRKLGRASDQRRAILRNQVTALIWKGRIVTTLPRAMEVRSIAEKLITLAAKEYKNTETVTKKSMNDKQQIVERQVKNDLPSKLHARRIIMSYMYDVQEEKSKKESKSEYKERTKISRHPAVDKLFDEYGPKYENRAGGYTRMLKMGPRRGDAAEMVVLELV